MKTTIALVAALAATPAMACTDWKAIAAFDAIIAANERLMIRMKSEVASWDSGSLPDFPSCAVFEANAAKGIPAKNASGEDITMARYKLCHAAEQAAQGHQWTSN